SAGSSAPERSARCSGRGGPGRRGAVRRGCAVRLQDGAFWQAMRAVSFVLAVLAASGKDSTHKLQEVSRAGNGSAPVPFEDLEPFGRENKAQALTEAAIKESNKMVDQIEKAEVAETKRSVFRALTRLRGAALQSFDGIAKTQESNIDTYTQNSSYRERHPVKHLASEEQDDSPALF
ncbi:unnamed protein product, partial [Effrenium voratum]